MIILGVVAALLLIVVAFIVGENNGEAAGYERGLVDGNLDGRKQLAHESAEDGRRQRETMERVRQHEHTGPIDDIASVSPEPVSHSRHPGKRPKRR